MSSCRERCGFTCRSLLLMLCLAAAGCSSNRERTFVAGEKTQEAPERHREQIASLLARFYGTPYAPTMKRQAPEAVSQEETSAEPALRLVDHVEPAQLLHGAQVYALRCEACHGTSGDGNGPVAEYLDPRPRDYRRGVFKFGSTARGIKPTRSDLRRIVRRGAKGTSMPAFAFMSDEDVEAVLDYVLLLSQRGELEAALVVRSTDDMEETDDFQDATAAALVDKIAASWEEARLHVVEAKTPRPAYDAVSIARGREVFLDTTLGCAKCHGNDATGSRKSNEVLTDDWGHPGFAADLTAGMLRGGRRPVDVYRRIHEGINGTKMPEFGRALEQRPDDVWHLVHFVLSKVEGRAEPATPSDSTTAQRSTEEASLP